jgi:hypothetical protein
VMIAGRLQAFGQKREVMQRMTPHGRQRPSVAEEPIRETA